MRVIALKCLVFRCIYYISTQINSNEEGPGNSRGYRYSKNS